MFLEFVTARCEPLQFCVLSTPFKKTLIVISFTPNHLQLVTVVLQTVDDIEPAAILSKAKAQRLTLRVADNKTGYSGVCISHPGKPKPFRAKVWRGGKYVNLGCFATAEEAAFCVARSPEGQAAAAKPAAALTSEQARQQAQAEGLTLLVADNKAGYFGVRIANPGYPRPFQARVRRGGTKVNLGCFATAEEAALCVARTPEAQVAEEKAAAAPLMSEQVREQAQAEGLTLRVADSKAGYFGVSIDQRNKTKLYKAQVSRRGKSVHLGSFATAEEAALCVARSPEGQAAAQRAAAAPPPLTGEDDGGDDVGEEGEEEIQVLDAVEVQVASDDDDEEEALAMEAEEVTLVVGRKRARESTRLGEVPRASR